MAPHHQCCTGSGDDGGCTCVFFFYYCWRRLLSKKQKWGPWYRYWRVLVNFEKSQFLVKQMVMVAVQEEEREKFHKKVLFIFVLFVCPCYSMFSKRSQVPTPSLHFIFLPSLRSFCKRDRVTV